MEMDELEGFLPLNADNPIKKYLEHHFQHFDKCINHNIYSSAFYHLHLLYMALILYK